MSLDTQRLPPTRLERRLRYVTWGVMALVGVGILVVVPVAVLVSLGLILQQVGSPVTNAVITGLGTLTIGYWGLVWWAERTGISDWNGDFT